jgi:hypothetical protein
LSALTPLTPAELQAAAKKRIDDELAAQASPIERARRAAAAKALADQQAIAGLGQAGASLMQGIGPGIQSGYDSAARALSDIAGGFSSATASRVRAGQDANRQFAAQQAPGGSIGGPDATNMQDVLFGLGGYIPSGALETQGAAANRWGQALPGIEALTTQQESEKARAEAAKQDADYAQQLIDLAAKRPELTNQVMDELYKLELDKLNARLNEKSTNASIANNKGQLAIQKRAQALYEKQFGETVKQNKFERQYKVAGLALENAKAKADLQAAIAKGSRPNASLSKTYGYVVDADGNAILGANGKQIPVKSGAKGGQTSYQKAVVDARSLRGSPVPNPGAKLGPEKKGGRQVGEGRYLARPGAKGVFPDGTTNNPRMAQTDSNMTFAEAQSYLMESYGISRANARHALISAGWKPDGKRKKKR